LSTVFVMLDLAVAGPIVTVLAVGDIVLHSYYDIGKIRRRAGAAVDETHFSGPGVVLFLAGLATLCSFWMVAMIMFSWATSAAMETLPLLSVLWSASDPQWGAGLVILSAGFVLHGWSRAVRRDMASSWDLGKGHEIVTRGPYAWIRHPSYVSYTLGFIGLFLMWPSIIGLFLLLGIPGYYAISLTEEENLLSHFGDEYKQYMEQTGRFVPKLRRTSNSSSPPQP
jgi:protein-S-isoprenylcysteine O-methyltransferase Ste14